MATWTVGYPAKSGFNRTRNFLSKRAAIREALRYSSENPDAGFVDVMRNGISVFDVIGGESEAAALARRQRPGLYDPSRRRTRRTARDVSPELKKEFQRLRREGFSVEDALQTARFRATWIGTVGDVNFPEYDGGPIVRRPDGSAYVDYVVPPEDDMSFGSRKARWTVYSVELDPRDWDWVNWKGVASSVGSTVARLRSAANSKDPRRRAGALLDIAGYHGWHELDQYPILLTKAEIERRYGERI